MIPRRRLKAPALAAAALLAGTLAQSCASLPAGAPPPVDPLDLLAPEALLYARLDRKALERLLPPLLPAERRKSLEGFIARSDTAALALLEAPKEGALPAFEAAIHGDFPRLGTRLSLAGSRDWRRKGSVFVAERMELQAAVPRSSLILAGSPTVETLLARAAGSARAQPSAGAEAFPGTAAAARAPTGAPPPTGESNATAASGPRNPLPAHLAPGATASDLLLWVPRPLEGFASAFGGGGFSLPLRGILVTGMAPPGAAAQGPPAASMTPESPNAPAAAPSAPQASPAAPPKSWTLSLVFDLEDARAARIYRPALRAAWFLLAKRLFPEAGAAFASPELRLDGALLRAEGLELREESLLEAIAGLAAPDTLSGADGR